MTYVTQGTVTIHHSKISTKLSITPAAEYFFRQAGRVYVLWIPKEHPRKEPPADSENPIPGILIVESTCCDAEQVPDHSLVAAAVAGTRVQLELYTSRAGAKTIVGVTIPAPPIKQIQIRD